jgi:hypothetical protein
MEGTLAVLVVEIKVEIKLPPGSGPKSSQHHRLPKENGSPDPPPDPPGGRGDRKKLKSVLKYSWGTVESIVWCTFDAASRKLKNALKRIIRRSPPCVSKIRQEETLKSAKA